MGVHTAPESVAAPAAVVSWPVSSSKNMHRETLKLFNASVQSNPQVYCKKLSSHSTVHLPPGSMLVFTQL